MNKIASVYDKRSVLAVLRWITSGLLRYANTQKSRDFFRSQRLQLPREVTGHGANKPLTERDVFKNNLQLNSKAAETEQVSAFQTTGGGLLLDFFQDADFTPWDALTKKETTDGGASFHVPNVGLTPSHVASFQGTLAKWWHSGNEKDNGTLRSRPAEGGVDILRKPENIYANEHDTFSRAQAAELSYKSAESERPAGREGDSGVQRMVGRELAEDDSRASGEHRGAGTQAEAIQPAAGASSVKLSHAVRDWFFAPENEGKSQRFYSLPVAKTQGENYEDLGETGTFISEVGEIHNPTLLNVLGKSGHSPNQAASGAGLSFKTGASRIPGANTEDSARCRAKETPSTTKEAPNYRK